MFQPTDDNLIDAFHFAGLVYSLSRRTLKGQDAALVTLIETEIALCQRAGLEIMKR